MRVKSLLQHGAKKLKPISGAKMQRKSVERWGTFAPLTGSPRLLVVEFIFGAHTV
jgi:hypothetical protein